VRRLIGFLAISSLTLTACAGLLSSPPPSPDPAPAPCVVRYTRILPDMYLGEDGCDHRWIAVPADSLGTPKCLYWSEEDGVLMEIPCPAPGDTLGAE